MPQTGEVNWIATFEGPGNSVILAQLYDEKGDVVRSQPVECDPPIGCPFPMDSVPFGTYTAGLANGTDRYYYQGEEEITTSANAVELAVPIELDSLHDKAEITINVQV